MDRKFWAKVWGAIQKLIAFGVFMVAHYGIDYAFKRFLMDYTRNTPFLEDIFHIITFAAFMIVYIHLLWEFVTVFVPQLGGRVSIEGE